MDLKPIKPGKQTSEFLFTAIAGGLAIIALLHPEAGQQLKDTAELVLATALPGYAISRGIAKQ